MSDTDNDTIGGSDELAGPWVENLRKFFAEAGEPLPEEIATTRPFLFVNLPPDDFARRCIEVMAGRYLLFRRGREVGTVDEHGEWLEMNADRLRTWLPATAGVIPFRELKKDGQPVKCAIPPDLARAILASDEFRLKLPELKAINLVRLPVLREELDEQDKERRKGFRKIELLPLGYDPESLTLTLKSAPKFDVEMDPDEAIKWLRDLLQYFAFSDKERFAVQIAAMLTIFGRGLFHGRSPMFLWNSNLPGSGKSRLSQLCLDPIYGDAGKSGYSFDRKEEVCKELDAAAQVYAPYIWFDDVPKGKIVSTDLNRWLTAKTWRCRVLGTKNVFNGAIYAATFMTGAQLELDNMIARRTLVVDLFPRQKSRNRHLPADAIPINDDFFEDPEMRGKILASLWALIRYWDGIGRPSMQECPDLQGESPLESFESWSNVIPPIVAAVSMGNCLKTFDAPDAGDTETREFENLAELLIREFAVGKDSAVVTMADTVATARKNGLFVDRLGSLDDIISALESMKSWEWKYPPEIDEIVLESEVEKAKERSRRDQAASWTDKRIQSFWGKLFRKSAVSGQLFEVEGDVWEFGTRASSRKSEFPITKVKAPPGMGTN